MIGTKACSLASKQEYRTLYPDIHNCKFIYKWIDGFMSRYLLVNRHCTTVAQKLPEEYKKDQQAFLSYILYHKIEYNYPLSLIGNIDETL